MQGKTTTVSPRRWWVHGSDRVLDIVLDAYRTFGVSLVGRMDPTATGEMGQIVIRWRSTTSDPFWDGCLRPSDLGGAGARRLHSAAFRLHSSGRRPAGDRATIPRAHRGAREESLG